MSKISETSRNASAIRDLTDAELDGVNGGSFISAMKEALWCITNMPPGDLNSCTEINGRIYLEGPAMPQNPAPR